MSVLKPQNKHPDLNNGTVLLVGADGLHLDQLAAAILKENKSFEVNIHLAKRLPLPAENEHSRPRIDLIVFLMDLRSQHSVETVKASLAYVDVNYFLGKVCFLAVGGRAVKHQSIEMYTLKQLADSYSSPLIPAELESAERRSAIAQRLIQILKVAAGLVPGMSALALSSLIRPSFKTETERC
ncbi:centromere protein M [Hemiscyllium ocellatum]|uniref:centromere protein M n=1 Tax=Hemiscyllium ocellatum TaxID=170820 RepID=UPI002966A9C0|nr:centromere protein M [Hemiscyllium ocellatum]